MVFFFFNSPMDWIEDEMCIVPPFLSDLKIDDDQCTVLKGLNNPQHKSITEGEEKGLC